MFGIETPDAWKSWCFIAFLPVFLLASIPFFVFPFFHLCRFGLELLGVLLCVFLSCLETHRVNPVAVSLAPPPSTTFETHPGRQSHLSFETEGKEKGRDRTKNEGHNTLAVAVSPVSLFPCLLVRAAGGNRVWCLRFMGQDARQTAARHQKVAHNPTRAPRPVSPETTLDAVCTPNRRPFVPTPDRRQ